MKKIILRAILIILVCAFLYFLFINLFIYPCRIEGMSMFPTIAPNEIIFTNRWKIITKQELKRNDVIVFEEPDVQYVSQEEFDENNLLAQYSSNNFNIILFQRKLIKRIIGLPNDHIQITEENELYVNGEKIGYVNNSTYMYVDLIVPENSVYVLGDNVRESIDSRSFGCIPMNKIYSVIELAHEL